MSTILIFDLDDTLYLERSYVESGFKAVADNLQATRGWPAVESLAFMKQVLQFEGRGFVFNRLLALHGEIRQSAVADCVKIYRQHVPELKLFNSAYRMLACLELPLYLVTDGHKQVQQRKIQALGIESLFKKVYITHRYGLRYAKPSIHCFQLIQKRERCDWKDMVYIGDNPAKDFVNLKPLGVSTVRVLTGEHRAVKARPDYEALYVIDSLDQLESCLPGLQWK